MTEEHEIDYKQLISDTELYGAQDWIEANQLDNEIEEYIS